MLASDGGATKRLFCYRHGHSGSGDSTYESREPRTGCSVRAATCDLAPAFVRYLARIEGDKWPFCGSVLFESGVLPCPVSARTRWTRQESIASRRAAHPPLRSSSA